MQKLQIKPSIAVGNGSTHSPAKAGLQSYIGSQLRQLRRRHALSLDQLAQRSGVSRAMLGQIETGKSSPTVALLSKVAGALGVPIASLIAESTGSSCRLLSKSSAQMAATNGNPFTLRTFMSHDAGLGTGFYEVNIASGHRQEASLQLPGTRGCLAVSSGLIELTVGHERPIRLGKGDALLFDASLTQIYFNPDDEIATAFLVLSQARYGQLPG